MQIRVLKIAILTTFINIRQISSELISYVFDSFYGKIAYYLLALTA